MTYIERIEHQLKYYFRRFWAYKRGKILTLIVISAFITVISVYLALDVPEYPKNYFNTILGISGLTTVFFTGFLVGDFFK